MIDVIDFIAGWIAGVVGTFVGYPLDTLKVRQQNFSTTIVNAAVRTYKHEGISGFYRGMASPVIAYGPSNSIFFGLYGQFFKILQPQHERVDKDNIKNPGMVNSIFIAGCIGGFFQAAFMCPVELIKIIMQTGSKGQEMSHWGTQFYNAPYNNSFQAFFGVLRTQGIHGLFRGFIPILIRDVPTSGIYMATYEIIKHSDAKFVHDKMFLKQVIGGGLAGILSIVPVYPIDVVKTRIQADDPENPHYRGMMDCYRKLYKTEGLNVFFKGAGTSCIRAFPVHATIFVGYEFIYEFLTELVSAIKS